MSDQGLASALEASAAEARARGDRPLTLPLAGNNDGELIPRASLLPPLEHHFAARGGRVARGGIRSRGFLDQFNAAFAPLIAKHGVAGSICGYATAAAVSILCQAASALTLPRRGGLTSHHIESLLDAVRDRSAVFPLVDRSMARIGASRRAYVAAHLESFPGGASGKRARDHFRGWVANYELSDLLQADALVAADGSAGARRVRRHFARFNQFPELAHATPDEAARIAADEARFGGRVVPGGGGATYAPGDSVFMIERFGAARALETPAEWSASEGVLAAAVEMGGGGSGGGGAAAADAAAAGVAPPLGTQTLRVFALDLNGHYSAAFACLDAERDNAPLLVLVNSTELKYADHLMVQLLFDELFPPAVYGAAPAPAPPAQPRGLAELAAMGFDKGRAREALAATGGATAAAVELLLG